MAKFRMTRIEAPEWASQPELHARVTVAHYAAIQRHREKMLKALHREIEAYVNDPELTFDAPASGAGMGDDDDDDEDSSGFPSLRRLNGKYYIQRESYVAQAKDEKRPYEALADPAWVHITVMCHCLEHAAETRPEGDYLGLDVSLKCMPKRWGSFEVCYNTNSSSI